MLIYDNVAYKETEQIDTLQWNFAITVEDFVAGLGDSGPLGSLGDWLQVYCKCPQLGMLKSFK